MRLLFSLLILASVDAAADAAADFTMPPKLEFKTVVSEFNGIVSSDGSLYATGDPSGVNVWKFGDTKPMAHIAWPLDAKQFGEVMPQTFSVDNKKILMSRVKDNETIELAVADLETEKILGALRPRRTRLPRSGAVKGWVRPEYLRRSFFSQDGQRVSSQSDFQLETDVNGVEEIVFTTAGKVIETKSWKTRWNGKEWVPDDAERHGVCSRNAAGGPRLAIRLDAGSCAVMNCETNKRMSYLDDCDATKVDHIWLSNDGSRVMAEGRTADHYSNTATVWDAATGMPIMSLVIKAERPWQLPGSNSVLFDASGRFIARQYNFVDHARVEAVRLDLHSVDTGERLARLESAVDPGKEPHLSSLASDGSVAYMFVRDDKGDRGVMSFWRFGKVQAPAAAPVAALPPAPMAPTVDIDLAPKSATTLDPNSFAVVIGVEKYRQSGIPAVNFASRDAKAMYGYLTQAMGFDPKNVVTLTDGEATKTDFDKHFGKWLQNRVNADSRVFIYYAGHGAPNPTTGAGYLMPYEADPSYLDETAYPVAQLYAQLAKLPTRDVTVVLDACFSGQGQRSLIAAGTRPLVTVMVAPAPEQITVIAAASGTQISASDPVSQHGLLTYHLLAGLRGDADRDKDGRITAEEAFAYAQPAVERAARLQNVEQVPSLSGGGKLAARRPWVTYKTDGK